MEKSKLIKKIRELAKLSHMSADKTTINQSEIAVLMKTFGISWNEVKHPSNSFTLYYEMEQTETDLRQEFESMLKTLKLAKEKGLQSDERNMKLMLKGFITGVRFFNQELSYKFSLFADKGSVLT